MASRSSGNTSVRQAKAYVKVNGADIDKQYMDELVEIIVDSSLNLPDMVELSFHDDQLDLTDGNVFPLGASIEIEAESYAGGGTVVVFKGEITSVATVYDEGQLATFTVRGYDKSYRLHRESKTKAWLEMTDSDIAQSIAGNVGLSPQVEATTEVFKHVFQNGLSDMEFLQQRAARIGFEVFVRDEKLYFRKPDPTGQDAELEYGTEQGLHTFHVLLTVANQVNKVTVKGWDVAKKEAITGEASSSQTAPQINVGGWGGAVASSKVSSATRLEVRQPVQSQADADAVAKAILNEVNGSFIEAEGEAHGTPHLKAGMVIKLTKLGSKFSGKYKLTTVRHSYSADNGFMTFFTVEGMYPGILTRLLREQRTLPWGGVVPAIVTNNESPEDYAMVKVKYPWLTDTEESHWARVVQPGGGADRGFYILPEIDDEVLVAFEHGDFNRPYIIGGLNNGRDAPSDALGQIVVDGAVKTRIFRSRTGHTIRLVDEQGGDNYIEIVDAQQKTSMKFDTANETISVDSSKDITLEGQGNITLTARGNIEIKATGNLTMEGQQVDLSAQSNASLKANAQMNVKGAQTTVEGTMATVKGSASLILQGGIVKIN